MRVILAILVLFIGADAFAADISLPAGAQVDKAYDLSIQALIRIFGNAADFLIGPNPQAGSEKFLGGLIQATLEILNLCAMVYVSGMIMYFWGIGALTTAHRGEKLGAGMFNSIWIPVRHTTAFLLTIPVLKGFSALQVGMMLSLGLGINMANTVWDYAGALLLKNIEIEAQNTNVAENRTDAAKLLPIFFKATVANRILEDKSLVDHILPWEQQYSQRDFEPHKGQGIVEYPIEYDGKFSLGGPLIRIDDYESGIITIRQRPVNNARFHWWEEWWSPEKSPNPGLVQIDMPACGSARYGGGKKCPDTPEYRMKLEYAEKRVKRLLGLWDAMDWAADVYLHSYGSAGDGCSLPPCVKSADEAGQFLGEKITAALDEYARGTAKDLKDSFEKYADGDMKAKVEKMLKSALDNKDGKSIFGWMSAGMLPFTIATVQQSINSNFTVPVGGYNGSATNIMLKLQEFEEDSRSSDEKYMNANYTRGLKNSVKFFNENSGRDATYSMYHIANSGDRQGAKDFKEKIWNAFFGASFENLTDSAINAASGQRLKDSHAGFLGWALTRIGAQDPILVLQNFGSRLTTAARDIIAGTAAFGVISKEWHPFFICLFLFTAGLFFEYGVPFIPIMFWCKALVSWLFLVVEAMVAAPFWVCAHAMPQGKGFAGDHARRGYVMFLDILIRPTLLVTAAVFAYALIKVIGLLLARLFNYLFIHANLLKFGFLGDFCYATIVMAGVYWTFYTVFTRGILYFPEQVINWLGFSGKMGIGGETETLAQTLAIQKMTAGQVTQQINSGAAALGNKAHNLGKNVIANITAKR